jgi:probable HAF family extracellular repeat protein
MRQGLRGHNLLQTRPYSTTRNDESNLAGAIAMSKSRSARTLMFSALLLAGIAHAQQYSVTEIPPAPGEATAPVVTAINASGSVVGVLGPIFAHSPVPGSGDPSFNWPEAGEGAHAFQYSSGATTDLGSLLPNFCGAGGAASSQLALSINAGGQLTGVSECVLTGAQSAFFGSASGGFTAIPQPAGTLAIWGEGINTSGQVVGTIQLASPAGSSCGNTYHTFLYDPTTGVTTDLGTFFGCSSHGEAINDSGQIAGTVGLGAGEPHAYLYAGGKATDIGGLATCTNGAVQPSYGLAINASGQVTGSAWAGCGGNGPDAFIYSPSTGAIQDIGQLGGGGAQGNAINSSGQVVGVSYTSSGALHAFLYASEPMVDLNSLISSTDAAQYQLIDAVGINDSGQIAVQSIKVATGEAVTLLLTPAASVPNVVGDTQSAAANALTAAGFLLGKVTTQASTTVAPGIVISQSPSAGSSVTAGSAVDVILSSGPPRVAIGLAGAPRFRDLGSVWLVTVSIENNGNITADTIRELSMTLNGISSLSGDGVVIASLAPGSVGYISETFPLSLTSGALKVSGIYAAGGLGGNWSVGARVAVPTVK